MLGVWWSFPIQPKLIVLWEGAVVTCCTSLRLSHLHPHSCLLVHSPWLVCKLEIYLVILCCSTRTSHVYHSRAWESLVAQRHIQRHHWGKLNVFEGQHKGFTQLWSERYSWMTVSMVIRCSRFKWEQIQRPGTCHRDVNGSTAVQGQTVGGKSIYREAGPRETSHTAKYNLFSLAKYAFEVVS